MNILAINASPNGAKGNTALILTPFLEGAQAAGAQVEVLYTKRLRVKPCLGDFRCWLKTPGACVQEDDMAAVLAKVREADALVLATPVYVDGMAGPLKNLVDRLIPLIEPFFELREGHCRHPLRPGQRALKVVLVANCGFWERDNFDPLVMHVQALCKNLGATFAGALLRPHGPALTMLLERGSVGRDVLEAAREAGRQLAVHGELSTETLAAVSRELAPLDRYFRASNAFFEQELKSTRT